MARTYIKKMFKGDRKKMTDSKMLTGLQETVLKLCSDIQKRKALPAAEMVMALGRLTNSYRKLREEIEFPSADEERKKRLLLDGDPDYVEQLSGK